MADIFLFALQDDSFFNANGVSICIYVYIYESTYLYLDKYLQLKQLPGNHGGKQNMLYSSPYLQISLISL